MIPCKNFLFAYLINDKPIAFIKPETWHIIEKPLKQIKKLMMQTLIKSLELEDAIILQPLVISIEPIKKPCIISLETLKILESFKRTAFKKMLSFKYPLITEKIIIYPPTFMHTETALSKASLIMINKGLFIFFSLLLILKSQSGDFISKPIIKQEMYTDNRSIIESLLLFSIEVPTAPATNNGLGFVATFISFSQLFLSINPSLYMSQAYFAPKG